MRGSLFRRDSDPWQADDEENLGEREIEQARGLCEGERCDLRRRLPPRAAWRASIQVIAELRRLEQEGARFRGSRRALRRPRCAR